MRQQINLFQAVLIDKPEPFHPRQCGIILLGFLALLLILAGFSYWQLQVRQQTLTGLQQREGKLRLLVEQLEKQFPPRQKNPLLEENIRQAEQQLTAQKQLFGFLANRNAAGNGAMISTLEGLAKNVQGGIWLKRIQLGANGQNIKLAGTALRPEQVPVYLQNLGRNGVFSGQVFSSLKLARLKEHPGEVEFSLQTTPEGQP